MDQSSIDEFLDEVVQFQGERVLFDARHLRWVDPNGMVGLLLAGSVAGETLGMRPRIELPDNADVQGYLGRMGFYSHAQKVFECNEDTSGAVSRASDVLLEITAINTNHDVHEIVDQVQGRASAMLTSKLGYPSASVIPFSVMLSEVCQNIIEHADGPGWVAAQAYNWAKRLGRFVIVISVMDRGRGFKGSLSDEHSARYGDRWSDSTALEAAFLHGLTRFADPGRGQGLQQIRKQVRKWSGLISARSGTARISQVPEWDDSLPMVDGMAPLQGAQISITLPAVVGP